ncbi:hypothetical protein BGZ49_005241 [Haplosporangium sp. Z 27]|nr:hypothetical protein BGZ49_005241 [Haplosporangium sp. Z 27]
MDANSPSSVELSRLSGVKPAVRFQRIRDDIAALDKELMEILRYNNYNNAEGTPPSMMEVIELAGLKREVGPSNIEQFLEVHIQLLEAFFKGSEKSVAGESIMSMPGEDVVSMAGEDTVSMAGEDTVSMAGENIEPLPKYSPNPGVIGHGKLDPSVVKNYELVFTELQGRLRR